MTKSKLDKLFSLTILADQCVPFLFCLSFDVNNPLRW